MAHKTYTAAQKAAKLAFYQILLSDGLSEEKAAQTVGVARGTLKRWQKPPKQKKSKGGRPRKVTLNEEETRFVRRRVLDHGSLPYAVEELLMHEVCTSNTRQILGDELNRAQAEGRRPSYGEALKEAARIPESVKAAHRGPKHAREFAPKARRNGNIVMEDGTEILWAAGCVYESDDMSINEPFRFHDPATGRETVGRQTLSTLCAASGFKMAFDCVGRSRDAYRIEDIADHFLSIVDQHGLPLFWRLEMGAWASNFVLGIKLKDSEERWGGLDNLFYVRHKFESTGKANVERSFDEQQKRTAHMSTSIGRTRGEYELATKLMRQANAGNEAALRRFWTINEALAGNTQVMHQLNGEVKTYSKFGGTRTTPEQLWKERFVRPLRAEDRWYFLPVKKQVGIRKQVIECKVPHYPLSFRFITTGLEGFPLLAENYSVLIAFHPGHPEEGCHVFNAETGAKNVYGYDFAEFMGVVPLFRDVPEENLAGTGDFSQVSHGAAAIRKEHRTIVPAGTGPGTLKSTARDGLGNALTVQRGDAPKDANPQKGSQPDSPPRVKPPRREPAAPVKMSRFGGRNNAEEIKKLTASLTEE